MCSGLNLCPADLLSEQILLLLALPELWSRGICLICFFTPKHECSLLFQVLDSFEKVTVNFPRAQQICLGTSRKPGKVTSPYNPMMCTLGGR